MNHKKIITHIWNTRGIFRENPGHFHVRDYIYRFFIPIPKIHHGNTSVNVRSFST